MKRGKGFTLLELIIALAVIAIVSGGLFIVFRQTPRSALENASLQLQADLRYVQRRAIIEGRRFRLQLNSLNNGYYISFLNPIEELRRVYFENGVRIRGNPRRRFEFLPRGTPDGATSTTLTLYIGRYEQDLTILLSGGRVYLRPIRATNLPNRGGNPQ